MDTRREAKTGEGADMSRPKQNRGFRAMSPEKQKEIASLGGKAAHAKGTAHEFTSAEAKEAGRKGGREAQKRREAARTPTDGSSS